MGPIGRANLAEALGGLLAAKQRSTLALIGIVIGVASVSSMISVGTIVRAEAVRQFQELGTDVVNVRLRPRSRDQGKRVSVRLEDTQGIVALPGISAAAPYTIDSVHVVLGGAATVRARVVGATPALADLNRLRVARGRFVSKLDAGTYFCTIGADIAKELRAVTGGSALGETVRTDTTVLRVVGVLDRAATGQRPFDPNRAVIIPVESARRVTPRATLQDIAARMSPGTHHAQVAQQVRAWFRHRAPHVRTAVRSAEELIEQLHQQMRLYTLLLGTVGGISLLVGGIGVMNVMLVAVAERKAEIGIRRALGARRRDIQMQFLSEAMILSLLGGVIGAGLAVAATWGICRFTGWVFTVSPGGTALGTVVAGGAGIVFGFYPAHQAARLNPVVALQGR